MVKSVVKSLGWRIVNSLPDAAAVRLFYFRTFGRLPNLSKPSTFNEKITWRKLHQPNERFKIFSDKIAVKPEIAKLIGESSIIKNLWTGENPDEIPYDKLTPPYVIKTNHGQGGNKFIHTSADIDKAAISASLRKQLSVSHDRMWREWGYQGIKPMILVEEMLINDDGEIPNDYKFFVYHGRAHYVQVICSRFKEIKRQVFDRNWKAIPVAFHFPSNGGATPPPANLAELIGAAEKIGAEFDFARVDLYLTSRGIKFGEVTFYPAAGLGHFTPPEWDLKFGEPWRLPSKSISVR